MLVARTSDVARYDALFLSPHLDDVALSCPAAVLAVTRAGGRALVVTLFSEGMSYEGRKNEEARAAAAMGADHLLAGFDDAPFRSAIYTSFMGIVSGRDPADAQTVTRLAAAIAEIAERAEPAAVHAPLGVGTHIDHRLCHEAARSLPVVRYYEDRPYALVRHAALLRLRDLGFEPPRAPAAIDAREVLESFLSATHVKRYLAAAERDACLEAMGTLARLGPAEIPATAEVRELPWSEVPGLFSIASTYASQIGDLYDGLADFEDRVRSQSRELGVPDRYVERSWRLDPATA
ncbi:MAG: PIG-L family deacetylase [Acidobacteriota bacterium]